MSARIPYFADTKAILRGCQLFFVNPLIGNEGQNFAATGGIPNYPYKLPFLAHNFPVRRISLYNSRTLSVLPELNPGGDDCFLTLRKADGTYLLSDVPTSSFLDGAGFNIATPIRQLLFTGDFFPDPRMSYVKWSDTGASARLAFGFHYG